MVIMANRLVRLVFLPQDLALLIPLAPYGFDPQATQLAAARMDRLLCQTG